MRLVDMAMCGRSLVWVCPIIVALGALPARGADDAGLAGEKIYKSKCAECHGAQGEGGKTLKRRLEGEKSVAQLAELIGETMPEDDPGSLSAEDAAAVAAYIHDAFYSPVARERNRPPRIELARLTVRQYRQAVTDLIGSFRDAPRRADERGLNAEYYSGRGFGRGKPTVRRIDPVVNFDYGRDAPVPEIAEPHEFSLRWNGSVMAPETGEYEFVVRTEHAARLWINNNNVPLIDAWVKSGNDTEYRGSLFLLGGRTYPLRLEFSKAKQGVDDSKKQKEKPPSAKASIALLWKPPQGVPEPIPTRNLSPNSAPEAFVCTTAFPPDDRSYGWERGTSVSKAWDQATTSAALEVAGYVATKLDELAGTRGDAADRVQKIRSFCQRFAERAFRRPLTAEQATTLVDRQFEAAGDPVKGVKRVVLLVLKSPRFLYREVGGAAGEIAPGNSAGATSAETVDGYDVAARLSFGLWDSIPDAQLLKSAGEGKLATKADVAREAERMLADPRARTKLRTFMLNWAKVNSGVDLAKDAEEFPSFDPQTIADLRTSLELFLDDVLWSENADFRQLVLSDELYLNDRLARLYDVDLPGSAEFTKFKLGTGKRAGVLTHPYILASFSNFRESSPILRGVFLVRGVLGQTLRPPPESIVPIAPDLHPSLTTRERVSLQTKATTCATCHSIINPLGFALEHFDAVGRFRELDREKPIDAIGTYKTRAGMTVTFNGPRQLAEFLAGSDEAQGAFAEQLFHHLVQQSMRAYGPEMLDDLRRSFADQKFHIRKLVVEIMANSALTGRQTKDIATAILPREPQKP